MENENEALKKDEKLQEKTDKLENQENFVKFGIQLVEKINSMNQVITGFLIFSHF